jgi:CRISPR/Cas system-associated exonuclease Cas4 (RecB family)
LKITTDTALKETFLEGLKKKNSTPRPDIHVSDLTLCLREAFFRKVAPKPPSEKTLGYFVDGARRHSALQGLTNYTAEFKVKKWGITGSIDLLSDAPIEIKTTRGKSGISNHYLKQLGYYACLLEKTIGYLVIQRLITSEKTWEFYKVEFTDGEIAFLSEEIQKRAMILEAALELKNMNSLPKVDNEDKWKCIRCDYITECREGN